MAMIPSLEKNEYNQSMNLIYYLLLAYLLGSLTFATIIPKWLGYTDPRTVGSRNAGTTNVLRYTNKTIALLVLVGDTLKGVLAIWIASWSTIHPTMLGYVGLATLLGHIMPIFFKFQGGKGVATTWGILLMLHPILAVILCVIWGFIAYLSYYASLATMIAVSATPLLAYTMHSPHSTALTIIACIILVKHRDNFMRLYHREEIKWH